MHSHANKKKKLTRNFDYVERDSPHLICGTHNCNEHKLNLQSTIYNNV